MRTVTELRTVFGPSIYRRDRTLPQSRPGILVFSRSGRLQYVNRPALDMLGNIGQTTNGSCAPELPSLLLELRDQVQGNLECRLKADTWESFELSRMVAEGGQHFLIRGFGYPDREESRSSHIVILLEEVAFVEGGASQLMDSRPRSSELQPTRIGASAAA
jgi:hypothetical protein